VEDILLANRVAGMLNLVKPADRRWSESLELFSSVGEYTGTGQWSSAFIGGPIVAGTPANVSRIIVVK
jgi:hypothetical protein